MGLGNISKYTSVTISEANLAANPQKSQGDNSGGNPGKIPREKLL